jgi:drug/metabolite transporter (DMT)-like permease
MFLGEFMCLIVFHILLLRSKSTGKEMELAKPFNRFVLLLPALCDMTATSLMYVGLSLTDASIFQMLRGSVVIFTGIFRVVFLKKKQHTHHWIGMALVMVGTAVVGTASKVCSAGDAANSSGASKAVLGNILIIVAQVIVAVQMTVEEKFIDGYQIPPLQVVGWEGIFGFMTLSVVLTIMYFVPAPSSFCEYPPHCDHFEDAYDAFVQIGHSPMVAGMLALNIMSIAFFNYFGVSVSHAGGRLCAGGGADEACPLLFPSLAPYTPPFSSLFPFPFLSLHR